MQSINVSACETHLCYKSTISSSQTRKVHTQVCVVVLAVNVSSVTFGSDRSSLLVGLGVFLESFQSWNFSLNRVVSLYWVSLPNTAQSGRPWPFLQMHTNDTEMPQSTYYRHDSRKTNTACLWSSECVSLLWYEWVALSWIQWVDVTVRIVKGAIPQVFSQLEGHLPLRQSHFLPMPNVHLTAKIKHQHLHKKTQ